MIRLNDVVTVKKPEKDSAVDPEDYYYILNFQNKKGVVVEQTRSITGSYSYKVEFDNGDFGYFFEGDLCKNMFDSDKQEATEMDNNSNRSYLTTKEVAEYLDVTKTTIYKYVHTNQLKPVYEDDWKIDETMLFQKDDVLELKKEKVKPGLTTGDVAKELGLHQVTVNNYIKQGKLMAVKQEYNGKMMNFIQNEELERFKNYHAAKDKKDRKTFYSSNLELYLFQTLVNNNTGEKARIMELEGNEGTIQTEKGEVFPLEQMGERGYVKEETFPDVNHITKHGYITFRFIKPSHVASPILDIIESFYRAISHKNIRLYIMEGLIQLEVKPFLFKELKGEESRHLINILQDNIIEGKLMVRHNGLLLDSGLEQLTIYLPSEQKKILKEKAKMEGLAINEYVARLVNKAVMD